MNAILDTLRQDVGVVRHSDWLLVDQPMVDRFADATLDRQFIHIDPARAAGTAFGGTIAHGFLTLSLLTHLVTSTARPATPPVSAAVNYGLDRVRFVSPVHSGSRIRAASTLVEVEEKGPGLIQQTLDIAVEIEGQEKPALIATWLSRLII